MDKWYVIANEAEKYYNEEVGEFCKIGSYYFDIDKAEKRKCELEKKYGKLHLEYDEF